MTRARHLYGQQGNRWVSDAHGATALADVEGHCPTTWADFTDPASSTCSRPHSGGCLCPSKGSNARRSCPCNLGLVVLRCGCGGWLVPPDAVGSPCEFCETPFIYPEDAYGA